MTDTSLPHYQRLVLGGTFDHFHIGHEAFLRFGLDLAETIVVGLTTEPLHAQKQFAHTIQSYSVREQAITNFADSLGRGGSIEIHPIEDVYGVTLTDTSLEAIVVTTHTLSGAQAINTKRKAFGLPALPIHECPLVRDSVGEYISSTRIRQGIIDRDGFAYASLFAQDVFITDARRSELKKPLGESFSSLDQIGYDPQAQYILVGDVITDTWIQRGWSFALALIDGRSRRAPYTFAHPPQYRKLSQTLTNPAGSLSTLAVEQLFSLLSDGESQRIVGVDGEEDLLVLPAIMLAPLGTRVLYGDPINDGVVQVTVTEEKKQMIGQFLQLEFL